MSGRQFLQGDDEKKVVVQEKSGEEHTFSKVVLAGHSDIALRLLGEKATDKEGQMFDTIPHQALTCVLDHDKSLMPCDWKLRSSWNAICSDDDVAPVTCTYWINNLQNFSKSIPDTLFTLNPQCDHESILQKSIFNDPFLHSKGFDEREQNRTSKV